MAVSDVEAPLRAPSEARAQVRSTPTAARLALVGRGVGKTLIATGLLMFGFVAYQLWGTGIETARAQNSLENEFEELLAGHRRPTTDAPVDRPGRLRRHDSVPTTRRPASRSPDRPPSPAPVAEPAAVAEGDPIARIELPRIGVDKIVVAGVEKNDLKKGPGHYPGDAPSRPARQLGDRRSPHHLRPAVLRRRQTRDRRRDHRHDAGRTLRVPGDRPADRVAERLPGDRHHRSDLATLTLTSCHPKYTARERIIVFSELDVAASSGDGRRPDDQLRPTARRRRPRRPRSDEHRRRPRRRPTPPTTRRTTGIERAGGRSARSPATRPASTRADQHRDRRCVLGRMVQRSGREQPGRLLWGLLFAAIGVLSYLSAGGSSVTGSACSSASCPFVVTLYFFFQNVNRLLPPNL